MRRVPPVSNPSSNPLMPYKDYAPGAGPGSYPGAELFNTLLAEICHVIEYAGLTLDGGDLQQLRKAIAALIAAGGGGGGSAPVSPDFRVVTGGPLTSPPGSPALGSQYLVGASATGAFAGKDYQLASWDGTAWSFATVLVGRVFRISGTDTYYNRVSGGWASFTLPIAIIAGLQTALDAKVAKSGDTMSGTLALPQLNITGNQPYADIIDTNASNKAARLQSAAGSLVISTDNVGGGAGMTQRIKVDAITGNVGIGGDPSDKLDVSGGIRGTKLRATVVGAANALEFADSALGTQWAQYMASGYWALYSYVTGSVGQKFAISPQGGISVQGDAGTSAKVLTGGTSAVWKTLAELGIGKKLIYLASPGGSSITVTFPVAEPDTSYTVVGLTLSDNGSGYLTGSAGVSITGKTVNGFTATGIGTSSINIVFLAAIR